jgi:serine/threonine protein phosphatase 1
MSFFPFKFFTQNSHGRDFVVGDIHGMFSILESHLENLNFNPEIDRVFSVGDLIDRGPESYRVLEFLEQPWFHAIKGNHEMMLIEAKHKKTNYRSWIKNNGGAWWEDVDRETQKKIRETLEALPVAFEIATQQGNIGVVHADLPVGVPWQQLIHNIYFDEETRDYMMWSRNRIKYIELTGETTAVEGIDLVVMGHTPREKPLHISNLYYIDTGASYIRDGDLGHLTLLQIHPTLEEFIYPQL